MTYFIHSALLARATIADPSTQLYTMPEKDPNIDPAIYEIDRQARTGMPRPDKESMEIDEDEEEEEEEGPVMDQDEEDVDGDPIRQPAPSTRGMSTSYPH
jgi:hypothetical protein